MKPKVMALSVFAGLLVNHAITAAPLSTGGIYQSPADIQAKIVEYEQQRDDLKKDIEEVSAVLERSAKASEKEKLALQQAEPVIQAFIDGTTECKVEEAKLMGEFSDRMSSKIRERIDRQVSECYEQVKGDGNNFDEVVQYLNWLKIEAQKWLDEEKFAGAEADRMTARLQKIQTLIDFWRSQQ